MGRVRRGIDRVADRMLNATVLQRLLIGTASTILALFVGLVVVAGAGYDPVEFLRNIFEGSFGDEAATARPSL